MLIYPSILEETIEKFNAQFEKLAPYFDHFQIDIADGEFVEHRTVGIEEVGSSQSEILSRGEVRGLGDRGDIRRRGEEVEPGRDTEPRRSGGIGRKSFEFHLMVYDFQKEIENLEVLSKTITVTQVLVHLVPLLKSLSSPLPLSFPSSYPPHPPIFSSVFNLGIVLSPPDQVLPNWDIIKDFKTIQIMTIQPGFQGNAFMSEMLHKINELREKGYAGEIILDGGINDESLPIILKNKYLPDAVCPGSYLHEDISRKLKTLKDLIQVSSNP